MQQELGGMERSVFTAQWYDGLQAMPHTAVMNEAFWQSMMNLRNQVNKQLESLRNEGKVKSSLTADLVIYLDGTHDIHAKLKQLGDELRFVLLVSNIKIETKCPICEFNENISNIEPYLFLADLGVGVGSLLIEIKPSTHAKCERCWHHRADVGSHEGHETICGRCVENVVGEGEARLYA
jgi:isoleucyl-tRNA synthetase